ncbi:MAG: AAA family ATPase [Sporolactobacillus sp.]
MLIKNLNFSYPKSSKIIFNDLSFAILPHKLNILLGMNGEGKTTLFDIIAGIIKTDGIFQDRFQPQNILYHIQGVPILNTIRGKDYAQLILGSSGQFKIREMTKKKICDSFQRGDAFVDKINYLWETQYGKMSPGERRWFSVLLFCLINKELYIFDEPTAGLDPLSSSQIVEEIDRLKNKNKTVLYATHQIKEIEQFSDCVVHILYKGKIVISSAKENWIEASKKSQLEFVESFIKDAT